MRNIIEYNQIIKKVAVVFAAAFVLNAVWENLHSLLYANYMRGQITEYILLRAALADAVMILILAAPFIIIPAIKKWSWMIIPFGMILAVLIELWAMQTGRWSYNEYMPIVPILSVGLTPLIQLGLLGYLSYKIQEWVIGRKAG